MKAAKNSRNTAKISIKSPVTEILLEDAKDATKKVLAIQRSSLRASIASNRKYLANRILSTLGTND